MFRYRLVFLLLVACLVLGPTDAEQLRTTVVIELPEGHQGPVAATLHGSRFLESKGEIVRETHALEVPTRWTAVGTRGRVSQIQVLAPGYWSPPVIVGTEAGPVRIQLLPTGRIQGMLRLPRGEETPTEIEARFEQSAVTKSENPVPQGSVLCPVVAEQNAFYCAVPTGKVDLRLRAAGFVSHYRWGVEIKAERAMPLGLLELQRGGSVVGQVEVVGAPTESTESTPSVAPTAAVDRPGVEVRLHSVRVRHARSTSGATRLDRQTLVAKADARGFFHIVGVPPGRFEAQAEREGYGAVHSLPFDVFENTETRITQPLRLSPPVRLEFQISPSLDPYSQSWWVQVDQANLAGTSLQRVAEGRSSEEGNWRTPPVPRGQYRVALIDSQGSRWLAEDLQADNAEAAIGLEVPMLPLQGHITLAGEPLAATLYFGGRRNARQSLRVESNEAGKFDGFLPEAGTWVVEVQAMDPAFSRRLDEVPVRRVDGGRVEVDIALPALGLEGEIVGVDGKPTRGSVMLVDLAGGKRPEQGLTDGEGRFHFHGLAAGSYSLQAYASGGQLASERREIELAEDDPDPFFTLPVQELKGVSGRVISPAGPVVGAQVSAMPLAGGLVTSMVLPQQATDVEGQFHLAIPPATEQLHVTVLAPGYGLKTLTVDARLAGPVTLPVYRQAGALVLEFPPEIPLDQFAHTFQLEQNGLDLATIHLLRWLRIQPESIFEPGRMRIPMVEFGDFRFCPRSAEEARCASGYLPPQGELVLRLGSVAAAESGGRGAHP